MNNTIKFSLEKVYQVWNDAHGTRTEIGNDLDGLGIMEIRNIDENNKLISGMTYLDDEAMLLVQAITNYLQDKNTSNKLS